MSGETSFQFDELEKRFMESKEREKIKVLLKTKLQSDGWYESMKIQIREEIRKQGLQHVTESSLFEELKIVGRSSISSEIKTEIYELIKEWIHDMLNLDL